MKPENYFYMEDGGILKSVRELAMKLDENRIAYSEPSKCTGCGLCVGTCAPEAITLKKRIP